MKFNNSFYNKLPTSQQNSKIIYFGLIPDDDYYQFLKDADVLLMTRIDSPYANSGFPFKLGEYLATGNAVIDISTMLKARNLFQGKDSMTDSEFSDALFEYSAHLASVTATLVTHAVMTESQLNDLLSTIREMESMGKDIN